MVVAVGIGGAWLHEVLFVATFRDVAFRSTWARGGVWGLRVPTGSKWWSATARVGFGVGDGEGGWDCRCSKSAGLFRSLQEFDVGVGLAVRSRRSCGSGARGRCKREVFRGNLWAAHEVVLSRQRSAVLGVWWGWMDKRAWRWRWCGA